MPDILIRDIPEEIANKLSAKAAENGMDRMSWLKAQLVKLAAMPTIRDRYSFKAVSEDGAYVVIRREHGYVQRVAHIRSEAQFNAYQRACDYAARNELGDYEAAYKLLVQHFDEVFPG